MSAEIATVVQRTVPARPTARPREFKTLSVDELAMLTRVFAGTPAQHGMLGHRWNPDRIATFLRERLGVRCSSSTVTGRLRRAGVELHLKCAREPRLAETECIALIELLKAAPSTYGIDANAWTRPLISQLIERRYGVRVAPSYVTYLLRTGQHGIRLARKRRRLSVSQVEKLQRALTQSPRELGLDHDLWTHSLIGTAIERLFGVRYNPQSIRRLLRRWELQIPRSKTRCPFLSKPQLAQLATALSAPPSAVGIRGNVWSRRLIAAYVLQAFGVRYKANAIPSLLKRAKITVNYGLRPGGACLLNDAQLRQLRHALINPPAASGNKGKRWTHDLIVTYVKRAFDVEYQVSSVPKLLRRLEALAS